MKKICLLILLAVFFLKICFAQKGKNGAEIVNTTSTIVNEYTSLISDADSATTSITVSDNTLNTNGRFSGPLSAGDLIMIIQMQGATINGTAKDSTWGAITNYGNCGWYEFKQVAGVSGSTTINLQCPLQHNYTAAGNVQVMRVPRYTTLTVDATDILTCDAWNGATGGVLAVEVEGATTINSGGEIDATGTGFRGGVVQNSGAPADVLNFTVYSADSSGQKGESIAGYQTGYNVYGGMCGRGAPANGGGGGNSANASGGGGANAGMGRWTGNGNPDTGVSWDSAWNLEYVGFDTSVSSGGGRGGYGTAWGQGFSPLIYAPFNPVWNSPFGPGNDRPNVGGKGGRPLDYSSGRLFLGGGGGAGQENNNVGSGGANGGGIIYLLSYGAVSGGGTIISNGSDNSTLTANDGSGGGGGGGTVVLNSMGSITGISITANGGAGGSQSLFSYESEGPGGGGGGGYIATTNGGITCMALGGANGTTNSLNMTAFPQEGATSGGTGLIDTAANFCIPQLNGISGLASVCGGSLNIYFVSAITCGAATTYTWTLPSGWSGASSTDSITVIAGDTSGTITVSVNNGSCPGDTGIMVMVNPAPLLTIVPQDTSFCSGQKATLHVRGGGENFIWSPSTGLSDSIGDSVVASPTVSTTYTITGIDSAGCVATGSVIVNVVPSPNKPTFTQDGDTLISSSVHDNQWYRNDTLLKNDTSQNLIITIAGEYWVIVNNEANGCSTPSDSMEVSPTGINQLTVNSGQLTVYPNPTTGNVFITISSSAQSVKDWNLQVTDVLGRTVYSMSPLNPCQLAGIFEIDLSNLSNGVYFITVINKTGRGVFPIIKQN